MVDFRPLLFINALALMLLVTAGFASVRKDISLPIVQAPEVEAVITKASAELGPEPAETPEPVFADAEPEPEPEPEPAPQVQPEPAPEPEQPLIAEPFSVEPMAEEPEMLAMAEPVVAISAPAATPAPKTEPETAAKPAPEPEPATTGKLVLRSNVVGDVVTINGRNYGATRLDLELDPGRYDVTIAKPGYQPWTNSVALKAGQQMTLVGQLEELTRVEFRNGQWLGGVKTGDGTYEDDTGLRYEGHFIDGKFHGEGTAWYPDGSRYNGLFERNEFHGKGTLARANGDTLTGNWAQGNLHGQGSLTTTGGMLYVGGFRNGEFHGQGALTYPDGRTYEGEFSNGEFHGQGTEIFADGKKYDGQYMEGKFHGKGLLRNPNGSSIEATFRHGEPYGQVRLTTAAGEIFTARSTEPGVCYREKSYRATQCPQLEGW